MILYLVNYEVERTGIWGISKEAQPRNEISPGWPGKQSEPTKVKVSLVTGKSLLANINFCCVSKHLSTNQNGMPNKTVFSILKSSVKNIRWLHLSFVQLNVHSNLNLLVIISSNSVFLALFMESSVVVVVLTLNSPLPFSGRMKS